MACCREKKKRKNKRAQRENGTQLYVYIYMYQKMIIFYMIYTNNRRALDRKRNSYDHFHTYMCDVNIREKKRI